MRIWSRTKCKYTHVDDVVDTVTGDHEGDDNTYKCANCKRDIKLKSGWISHLYVTDNGEHDSPGAYVVCKDCMMKELQEEKTLAETYGRYMFDEPIEE